MAGRVYATELGNPRLMQPPVRPPQMQWAVVGLVNTTIALEGGLWHSQARVPLRGCMHPRLRTLPAGPTHAPPCRLGMPAPHGRTQ